MAEPVLMVVVGIDYLQPEGFGVACTFTFALEVFLNGKDVGVAVEDGRSYIMLQQALHNG